MENLAQELDKLRKEIEGLKDRVTKLETVLPLPKVADGPE